MDTCEWIETTNYEEVYWDTSCGETFVLESGTPEENNLRFCAYCGRKLVMVLACAGCGVVPGQGEHDDDCPVVAHQPGGGS